MQLALEETVELSVYAFPSAEGLVEDAIMCRCGTSAVKVYELP
jgi:CDGSH-type Zn-finger protein